MTAKSQMASVSQSPVFIHSLFRAGSTYIFNVFRRSENGYWCYQEPLHELALWSQEDPRKLLEVSDDTAAQLRHPGLAKPYFYELYQVSESCLQALRKEHIYDAYFSCEEDAGQEFFECLVSAAKGVPVIQECRTSMRIRVLKEKLGGTHLYLWRNPWDQWWSYKVDDFFDLKSQLFINGKRYPEVIARLYLEISFSKFESASLKEQFDWFRRNRLSPEKNYLVFYTLWFLGLQHGLNNADVLINIDCLSYDADYQQKIIEQLEGLGIDGLDFSDCHVPQAFYGGEDRAFFERIEDKAHGLFLLSGMSRNELNTLLELRHSSEPRIWGDGGRHANVSSLVRDAERARALVIRAEEREVSMRAEMTQQTQVLVQHAEGRAQQEASRALQAEDVAHELARQLEQVRASANDFEQRLAVVGLLAHDQEQRAAAAEVRANCQEQRAAAAEALAQDQEQRAAAAEALAQDQEQRAVAAEARANGQEQRAAAAEALAHDHEQCALKIDSASRDLDEVRQRLQQSLDNAHHWYLQTGEWETRQRQTQEQLEASLANAHTWYLAANAKDAQVQALLQSTSWRITWPLRKLAPLLRGLVSLPVRFGRKVLRSMLFRSMRFVLTNPSLKRRVMTSVPRYPRLFAHLRQFASHHGLLAYRFTAPPEKGVRSHSTAQGAMDTSGPDLTVLTPQARDIYHELKMAILARGNN